MIEVLQSQMQKNAANFPTRLDVLQEYNKRSALTDKQKEQLMRLEAGYHGEKLVLSYLNEFGHSHWKVMKNLWLDNGSIFECDLLLITRYDWYAIEIKNFNGQYKLENGQWSCYGKNLPNNPISQSQKVAIHLQNLTDKHKISAAVKGLIVFTGNHFHLELLDSIKGVEIIQINQFRDFIKDIAWKERQSSQKIIKVDTLHQFIEQYETNNPFPAEDLSKEIGNNIQKGVICYSCGSFNLDLKSSYAICLCGMHEPKEMAIVRTITEYGVIHFNKDFETKELVDFFDGDFSDTTIRRYLNQYFIRYGNGRGTKYHNLPKAFDDLIERFKFKRKRYMLF